MERRVTSRMGWNPFEWVVDGLEGRWNGSLGGIQQPSLISQSEGRSDFFLSNFSLTATISADGRCS